MFLVNSRLGLSSATPSRSVCAYFTLMGHPFSRSYGVILPSSLTRVLPFILGFSPRPPVSVCGTGTLLLPSSFSRQRGFNSFPTNLRSTSRLRINDVRTSLHISLNACTEFTITRLCLSFCVTASVRRLKVVPEYQPVVHRLRLLSSA